MPHPFPPPVGFADQVISWQKTAGRHDLPWQRTRDAYRIWLSEIMLQQTQVSAVIPYYQRFLARFPDLGALAAAPIEAVLEHWAGLGYYARARNLLRCARQVVDLHGGVFPDDPAVLQQLSGIGRSTAAAIAAFANGRRAAILDGNVKRVLCRHFGIEGIPTTSAVDRSLWALAEALLPETDIEAYTQGMMDLGASLCRPRQPDCPACPLAVSCVAHQSGRQHTLPTPKPRRTAVPSRSADFLLVFRGAQILLERRPPNGIWGGLLVPPEGEREALLANLGLSGRTTEALPEFRHSFTHFHLLIRPYLCRIDEFPAHDSQHWSWVDIEQANVSALPSPFRKLLGSLAKRASGG